MLVAEREVLCVEFNIVTTSYLHGGPATPSEIGVSLDLDKLATSVASLVGARFGSTNRQSRDRTP
jgi:hypothetical protein